MSLGLGIFLSSLFLGIIFLFNATKDRWNWKKILLVWPLIVILVVGVIGGGGLYIYNQYENRLIVYDTYLNIPLNASEADVIFLIGDDYLQRSYNKDKSAVYISYFEEDIGQHIRFREDKIWRISCHSESSYSCPSLNRIRLHDSANEVKENLGEPDIVSVTDDNLERMWIYKKFNIYMMLSKGKVDSFGIFEPSLGIPELQDNQYDFRDLNQFKSGDKKITIKEIPLIVDESSKSLIDLDLFNEIIDASSDGDKVVWGEYVALKEKNNKEQTPTGSELKALAKEASKKEEEKDKEQNEWEDVPEGYVLDKPGINVKIKWSKLKKGMATYQVEKLLGAPIRKEGRYWYYSEDRRDGAHITFIYNSNAGVREVSSFKVP